MSEWKEYKLGELGVVITGKTPSSKNPEDWGEDMFFVTPTDYRNYRKYVDGSERRLSDIGVKRLENKILPPYSVLVTCIGSDMGKVVITRTPCITNQQINSIIPNETIDSQFLYYALINSYDVLRMMGGDGTAVPIVNKRDFENIKIVMPSLKEQKRIASILSSLDDKIDLLHRENKTLEAMAETLFRKWFIEEVRQEVSLGNVVETTSGGTPSRKHEKYYQNGAIDWVKSKELNRSFILKTEEKITSEAVENSSVKYLPANSVLIAMYGATVGEYAIIAKEMTCNQAICALKPNDNYPYTYLYLWAKFMQDEFLNLACGAAQQNISQVLIKQQQVCGDEDAIKQFHSIVGPFFEKIKQNEIQLSSLEEMKNMILPKLMNNELKIDEL